MMLFEQSFRRELRRAFGITLVILLTIVLTIALIRTLSQATGGRVDAQDVLLLLAYTGLGQLPIVLTLALFVAVVAAVGRLYRDSEMAVWMACGVPLRGFLPPLLGAALPVLAVVVVLVFWIWPWGHAQSAELRERYEKRSDLSRVTPGQFQASRDGRKVFFIDRDSDRAGVGRNVFILSQDGERESVTTAAEGEIVWDGADRLLHLRQGQRTESDATHHSHSVARFEAYQVIADPQTSRPVDELPPKAMGSWDLLTAGEARHWGELTWRLGMSLGAVNLVLIGLGLAASNPRRANSWGLLLALLVFVVYYNFVNLSQAWVARERLGVVQALLSVHGTAALLALILLTWRDEAMRWPGLGGLRRRTATSQCGGGA